MSAHGTHCCKIHGCKYYGTSAAEEKQCPVQTGDEVQQYPCEWCHGLLMDEVTIQPGEAVYTVHLVLRKRSDNEAEGASWLPEPTAVRDAILAQMDAIHRDEGWYITQVVE